MAKHPTCEIVAVTDKGEELHVTENGKPYLWTTLGEAAYDVSGEEDTDQGYMNLLCEQFPDHKVAYIKLVPNKPFKLKE